MGANRFADADISYLQRARTTRNGLPAWFREEATVIPVNKGFHDVAEIELQLVMWLPASPQNASQISPEHLSQESADFSQSIPGRKLK